MRALRLTQLFAAFVDHLLHRFLRQVIVARLLVSSCNAELSKERDEILCVLLRRHLVVNQPRYAPQRVHVLLGHRDNRKRLLDCSFGIQRSQVTFESVDMFGMLVVNRKLLLGCR